MFTGLIRHLGHLEARRPRAGGARLIDYSGDFRFTTAAAYADYATRIGKDIRDDEYTARIRPRARFQPGPCDSGYTTQPLRDKKSFLIRNAGCHVGMFIVFSSAIQPPLPSARNRSPATKTTAIARCS